MYPIWDFGSENIPSGNPASDLYSQKFFLGAIVRNEARRNFFSKKSEN
jgi:hypothetical protein